MAGTANGTQPDSEQGEANVGVLDRFEKGIERVVNQTFAKAFRSQVEPVELAGALKKEADTHAAVVSRGRTLTSNNYVIELAASDFERLDSLSEELTADLRQVVGEHAIEQGYSFVGPVTVTLEPADDLDTGIYRVRASTRRPDGTLAAQPSGRGGYDPPSRSNPIVPEAYESAQNAHRTGANPVVASAASAQAAPASGAPANPARGGGNPVRGRTVPRFGVKVNGQFTPLRQGTTVFGRSSQSADFVLDDPGISRRHFEITIDGTHATATDLGSTNGTLHNGHRITSITLTDGVTLTAGDTSVTFCSMEMGRR
ncbi:DUF3662 and FHA domain-containing protein [Brevibacterium mcbrellneri]|uniref:DUF3662 and FHA domain-containing protein n=1 Tax=Brevibacterium mcbrellneri TaxID=53363 RepID=UPI0002E728BC|nr:DUF3662 and FHA domain-containing protein [Brevibacterium mcbrellneri]